MRVLFIGDIVGKGARKAVCALVPELRREFDCCFCIANGENVAGGSGLTRKCVIELAGAGVDVITTGDHVWDQRDFVGDIAACPNVLRPANLTPGQPGAGWRLFRLESGVEIAVVSLLGRTFMNSLADCPFQAADRIVTEARAKTGFIIVDFHAEATSEKIAMGWFLDGRVSAVLGTHTHVPTADETVLPQGTAFQCDVGMVGGRISVLGRAVEPVLQRFVTGMPARFTVVEKDIRLCATLIDLAPDGTARSVTRILRDVV